MVKLNKKFTILVIILIVIALAIFYLDMKVKKATACASSINESECNKEFNKAHPIYDLLQI